MKCGWRYGIRADSDARARRPRSVLRAAACVLLLSLPLRAESQTSSQELDSAIRTLELAIQREPSNQEHCLRLGALLTRVQRFRAGLEVAEKTAGSFPLSPRALEMLGFFQWKTQHNVAAVESYTRALRLNPESAGASVGLGMAQMAAGMPREAARTFEHGIRRFPRHAAHYQAYGILLRRSAEATGESSVRAAAMFEAALKIDGQLAESYYQLGVLALERGLPGEAAGRLETAARLSGHDSRIHYALYRAYRRLNRAEDAAAALQRSRLATQSAAQ